MSKTLYLRCAPGDVGTLALLTGSPERIDRIATFLDEPLVVARNREFYTVTGRYQGQRVTAASSGIGAPSAAIAIEELGKLGVRAIVRVGTNMGIGLPLGSLVLATGAARFEGTSQAYLDSVFPAVPDWSLATNLLASARQRALDVRPGVVATYDAFYPKMAPTLARHLPVDPEQLARARVIAVDMETSLLFVLGAYLDLAVAALCLVTNNFAPFAVIDPNERARGEDNLIRAVLGGLLAWHNERDSER